MLKVLQGVLLTCGSTVAAAALVQGALRVSGHFGYFFLGEGLLELPLTALAAFVAFLLSFYQSVKLAQD